MVHDVRANRGHAAQLGADAEVADLDDGPVVPVRDEDVARVQVVVDDVVVVEELHRREQLARELDDEPLLHRDAEHRLERVVAALEREVEEVALLERVEDVDDVRVPQRQEPLHLARPLGVHLGVRAVRRAHHLHRVDLVERPDALVDGAELPRADDALHHVRAARPAQHRADLGELHREAAASGTPERRRSRGPTAAPRETAGIFWVMSARRQRPRRRRAVAGDERSGTASNVPPPHSVATRRLDAGEERRSGWSLAAAATASAGWVRRRLRRQALRGRALRPAATT